MNTEQKIENILQQIRDIEKKSSTLKNTDKISKIEMDIILERVRTLYEDLLSLENQKETDWKKGKEMELPITPEPKQEEEEIKTKPEKKEQPKTQTKSEFTGSEKKTAPEVTQNKKESETKKNQKEEPTEEENSTTEETRPEIVAEKFHNTKTFRHDNLSKSQAKNDVSSKMQAKPIHDLTRAIGVNDKFLFIRELFNGDRESYHEAVQLLNEMPNLQEAEDYIRERFDWDMEQQEVKKFMDLVRRKFI